MNGDDQAQSAAAGATGPGGTPARDASRGEDVVVANGRCLCGDVAFTVRGVPRGLYQCHCSLCRRQSGAASNAAFVVPAERLAWTHGQDGVRSYRAPTGFRSDFCGRCGSPVPNPVGHSPYVWIPAGLLDDLAGARVVMHLHLGSRAGWAPLPSGGGQHASMPTLEWLAAALDDPEAIAVAAAIPAIDVIDAIDAIDAIDVTEPADPAGGASIALDHLTVPSRDREAAARELAAVLDVPWGPAAAGPFTAVQVNPGLALDFDSWSGPVPRHHYAFRVTPSGFDRVVSRLVTMGVPFRGRPHGPDDGQVGRFGSTRHVYWERPDGHVWEALAPAGRPSPT